MANKIINTIMAAITPKAPDTLQVLAAKFTDSTGLEIVSSAELKKIQKLESAWWEAWRDRNERYTSKAANAEWQRQVAAGGAESPEGRFTLEERYVAASVQAQARMQEINAESIALIRVALENFIRAGESWIESRANKEKSEAAEFGVNYIPSAVLVAAQRAVASTRIRKQNLAPSHGSPGGHLPFITL